MGWTCRRGRVSRSRPLIMVGLLTVLVPCAVLAYGFWHQRTHGVVYVSVRDTADRDRTRVLLDTDVRLLDADGTQLAQVSVIPPHGGFSISQPETYACHSPEGEAFFSTEARQTWRRCFERQSRWVVGWANDVKYADLRSGSCVLRRVPVTVRAFAGDWALWWIPMPHGGGRAPYSSFHVEVAFDSATCESKAASPLGKLLFPPLFPVLLTRG